MTIGNYLKYLGIDGTVVLSEENPAELYVCKAFQLKKKSHSEPAHTLTVLSEYNTKAISSSPWFPILPDTP